MKDMLPVLVKDLVVYTGGTLLCGDENMLITGATTNSRDVKEGNLFIPVIGERVDGHSFINNAIDAGAICTFTSIHNYADEDMIASGCAFIKVENTICALQAAAKHIRAKYDIPVVGITGSVGKTTTKEMISAALESELDVLKTFGNMNSQVGLSLMMFRLEEEHDAAVIEMGVSEDGEMENLTDIAKPCFAVITNIGVSHINQFKTQENIRREKTGIINSFNPNEELLDGMDILKKRLEQANLIKHDVLFVNGDDKLLAELIRYKKNNDIECMLDDKTKEVLSKIEVISYGLSDECDYRASNIIKKDSKTIFLVSGNNNDTEVTINVPGTHNIYNALVAIAVADCFGIERAKATKGLNEYKAMSMRGEIIKSNGYTVINDTYNASPDSMKAGIDVLLSIDNAYRRIAVLADMFELGENSKKYHYDVGSFIAAKNNNSEINASSVDILITVGEHAMSIADAVNKESNKNVIIKSFDNNEEATAYLKSIIKIHDAVIVKGSRGMHTDKIVDELR